MKITFITALIIGMASPVALFADGLNTTFDDPVITGDTGKKPFTRKFNPDCPHKRIGEDCDNEQPQPAPPANMGGMMGGNGGD